MQEATLWIVPLLLTAAVAVLALSTQRRYRALSADASASDPVQSRRIALCRSAVTWLYASMAIFVGSVGLALTIRSAQYTYTSALSLCTSIGVLILLVANAQLLREALIETSPPTNGH
ncbi:MAG: hypothetical protein ACPGRY_17290 [Candidatus Latescibacterota bacterium]